MAKILTLITFIHEDVDLFWIEKVVQATHKRTTIHNGSRELQWLGEESAPKTCLVIIFLGRSAICRRVSQVSMCWWVSQVWQCFMILTGRLWWARSSWRTFSFCKDGICRAGILYGILQHIGVLYRAMSSTLPSIPGNVCCHTYLSFYTLILSEPNL